MSRAWTLALWLSARSCHSSGGLKGEDFFFHSLPSFCFAGAAAFSFFFFPVQHALIFITTLTSFCVGWEDSLRGIQKKFHTLELVSHGEGSEPGREKTPSSLEWQLEKYIALIVFSQIDKIFYLAKVYCKGKKERWWRAQALESWFWALNPGLTVYWAEARGMWFHLPELQFPHL